MRSSLSQRGIPSQIFISISLFSHDTIATLFRGVELVNAQGEKVLGEDLLADKVVARFFSADWCPYCHEFLPAPQTLYEEANAEDKTKRLEIVFVSSDTDNDTFTTYFKGHHGAWYAIPHGNAKLRAEIKRKYEVAGRRELAGLGLADRKGGVPTLVVVDNEGNALDYEGVVKVNKRGPVALENWEKERTARL